MFSDTYVFLEAGSRLKVLCVGFVICVILFVLSTHPHTNTVFGFDKVRYGTPGEIGSLVCRRSLNNEK